MFAKSLLVFLLLTSCSDYSKFTKSGNSLSLKIKDLGIEKASIVKWKVGPKKDYIISQGVRFSFSLPRFNKDSLKQLEEAEADSWLVKVHRISSGRTKNLINVSIPLVRKTLGGSTSYSSPDKGSVNVFYAAAAISERLRGLTCPAMRHRKLLDSYILDSFPLREKELRVSILENSKVMSKLESFVHAPPIINGGRSLIGKYYLELALYNSATKRKKSNLVKLSKHLDITKEEEVIIEECRNVKVRPQSGENSGIESFKFKR